MNLNIFLKIIKENFYKNKKNNSIIYHIIIGNEAFDLDSFVSSCFYAFYLFIKNQNNLKDFYFLCIPILKEDLTLRKDLMWITEKIKFHWEDCLFLEDIKDDIQQLHEEKR